MEQKNKIVNGDEIDLMALLKVLWSSRRTIIKTTLVFLLIGLFVAVFSEKEYTASTTFVPQTSESKVGGGLGGLAAMAGINLGDMNNDSGISPILYPQILSSLPFQLKLLQTPLTIEGHAESVSFKEYYTSIHAPGVLGILKKYTIGLPGLLISLIKRDPAIVSLNKDKELDILSISKKENTLIQRLSKQVALEIDEDEGSVVLSASMPEAYASAQLVSSAQQLLQKFIIDFKIKKSTEQLEYIKERYTSVEKKFVDAQMKLAKFEDKNKFVNSAMSKIELQTMQDEYNLVYGVYTELAKQLEAQYLQVTEDTPVFTILKPASIPLEKSKPKRGAILILFIIVGVFVGMGIIMGKQFFDFLKEKWQ
jgi:capsular polysaccharide biosynthesis protein